MTPVIPPRRGSGQPPGPMDAAAAPAGRPGHPRPLHVPRPGRIVTNNAASTQPPRELVALYQSLAPGYENVHRGQSSASQQMTALFEESYDTIAQFIGAPGRASIALYRNTTEAINAVMYSLLTEFRDGDNVVTTMMEHNSNYVPGMRCAGRSCPARAAGGLPSGPVRSAHRRAGPRSPGVADRRAHQARLLHRRIELPRHPHPAGRRPGAGGRERLRQPDGERRSYLLVDGAQLVPGSFVDVQALGRRLPGVLLSQDAGAVRGGGAVRQGAPAPGPRCRSCTAAT